MPGVYREKECPTCGTKHRKKGRFCSKSCSNAGRDEETRAKLSATAIEHNNIAHTALATGKIQEPPDPNNYGKFFLDDNQFIDRDGDLWTTI